MEKSHPFKKWKTAGFCDEKKKPVVLMKVPSFLNWDKNCELHHFKNGMEFCEQDEGTPLLSGAIDIKGHKRILKIGLEAVSSQTLLTASYDLGTFDYPWKDYGALKDVRKISMGGRPAFLAVIEDHTGKLPETIKSQTLIKFSQKYVGGMFYFIEQESISQGEIFVWHDEWILQNVVDEIIKSFEYKAKD